MNKTKIDWTDMSWNPITGCLKNCRYCYAKGITHRFGSPEKETGGLHVINSPLCTETAVSKRFHVPIEFRSDHYPFGFDPTLHLYRLDNLKKTKTPHRIFVGSMGDMFGEWVPIFWINKVFAACEEAHDHTYLFLTKNPARYWTLYRHGELPKTDNYWFGFTATKQKELENAHRECAWMTYNTFLSIEPLHGPVDITTERRIRWVIVGAETGTGSRKVIPEREWIEGIVRDCKDKNIPLFMKRNLQTAWGAPLIQELPADMMQG